MKPTAEQKNDLSLAIRTKHYKRLWEINRVKVAKKRIELVPWRPYNPQTDKPTWFETPGFCNTEVVIGDDWSAEIFYKGVSQYTIKDARSYRANN